VLPHWPRSYPVLMDGSHFSWRPLLSDYIWSESKVSRVEAQSCTACALNLATISFDTLKPTICDMSIRFYIIACSI